MSDTGGLGEILLAVWSGSFQLLGVEVRCHTLNNGQRIIEEESLAALLNAMSAGGDGGASEWEAFQRWRSTPPLPSADNAARSSEDRA